MIMEKIDSRKALYILEFIIIAIPLIIPMSIPLPVDKYTKSYFDSVMEMQESIVGFNQLISGASWPLLGSSTVRTTVSLWENGNQVVFFSTRPEGVPFTDVLIAEAIEIYEQRNPSAKIEYDVNYVRLGYIAGEETGFAAFMFDVKSLVPVDIHGTSTAQLSVLDTVSDGHDIDYMIWAIGGVPAPYGLRQYKETFGGTMVEILVTMMLAERAPYLANGQIAGAIIGSSATAQYEFLTGIPGPNVRLINALSLVSMMVILALLAGNVDYFYKKMKGDVN